MICKECRKQKTCKRAGEVKACKFISPKYDYRSCYICGRSDRVEEHHIFPGPLRKWSDKYGLTVDLCPECHRLGKHAAHNDTDTAKMLKLDAQGEFEKVYGHDAYMAIFGINYEEMD